MTKPKVKERLDLLLLERGLVPSRTKAQALILAGQVRVDGLIVRKVGTTVPLEKPIELVQGPKYVSRGGEKLEGALEDFSISPKGQICLDVGASTGGFTDCLLQRGALFIYAIDVGHAQLDLSLKQDPRVKSIENTHILKIEPKDFKSSPTLCVIDVSFISLKNVLAHIGSLLIKDATVLAMVKPQFEVGAKYLKKGVVKSDEIRQLAVQNIIEFAKVNGFYYLGTTPARLKGPKGNQEYFIHLKKI